MLYDDLKSAITSGYYTRPDAEEVLNSFRASLQLTNEQYAELMGLAKNLKPYASEHDKDKAIADLTNNVNQLQTRIAELEAVVQTAQALKK